MKRTILTTVLLTVSYFLYSQTTLEEYNYLTKGYKIQIESGLDMKKGYKLVDAPNIEVDGYAIQTKALVRDGEKYAAAVLTIFQTPGGGLHFICLPHALSGEDIWKMYKRSVNFLNESDMKMYMLYLSTMYSAVLTEFEIKDEPTTK